MLTGIGLRNFKAFGDEMQEAPLSKITLIYGQNSGGKSSLIQALMLLKQSLDSPRDGYKRELMVRGDTSRGDVDLGGFPTLIHQHKSDRQLTIKVGFNVFNLNYSAEINLDFVPEGITEDNSPAILDGIDYQLNEGKHTTFNAAAQYTSLGDSWQSTSNFPIVQIDNEPASKELRFFPEWTMISLNEYSTLGELKALIADELGDARRDLGVFNTTQDVRRRRGRRDLILSSIPVGLALRSQCESLEEAGALADELEKSLAECFGTSLSDSTQISRSSVNAARIFDNFINCIENGFRSDDDIRAYRSVRDREVAIKRNTGWTHIRRRLLEIEATSIKQLQSQIFRIQEIQDTYESCLRSIAHLGPIRDDPQRLYVVLGAARAFSGVRGEFTPNILYRDSRAIEKVNVWFEKFKIPYELKVKASRDVAQTGQHVYIELFDNRNDTPVTLADVGFGISCILPIIVEGVASPKGSIICVEQPELHLHPRLQAHLADLMIETAIEDGKQWIVETHSELIQLRLCARVAQKKVSPEDVAIVFVEPTNNGSEIIDLGVTSGGELRTDWPPGFFDEETEEIMKILESQQYDD